MDNWSARLIQRLTEMGGVPQWTTFPADSAGPFCTARFDNATPELVGVVIEHGEAAEKIGGYTQAEISICGCRGCWLSIVVYAAIDLAPPDAKLAHPAATTPVEVDNG